MHHPSIRASSKFVSYEDLKPFMADLKLVHTAVTEENALKNLMVFQESSMSNVVVELSSKIKNKNVFQSGEGKSIAGLFYESQTLEASQNKPLCK